MPNTKRPRGCREGVLARLWALPAADSPVTGREAVCGGVVGAARLTVRDRQPRQNVVGSLRGRSGQCEGVGAGFDVAVWLLALTFGGVRRRRLGGCRATVVGGLPFASGLGMGFALGLAASVVSSSFELVVWREMAKQEVSGLTA